MALLDNAVWDEETTCSSTGRMGAALPVRGNEAPDGAPFDRAWPISDS